MAASLDDVLNELVQIRIVESEMLKRLTRQSKIYTAGDAELTSSNLAQTFNDKLFYSVSLLLKSGSATDTNVRMNIVEEQGGIMNTYHMNTTQSKLNFQNIRLSAINLDSTSISTATLIVSWIGYELPTGPPTIWVE